MKQLFPHVLIQHWGKKVFSVISEYWEIVIFQLITHRF